jgi:hypothetical protein
VENVSPHFHISSTHEPSSAVILSADRTKEIEDEKREKINKKEN